MKKCLGIVGSFCLVLTILLVTAPEALAAVTAKLNAEMFDEAGEAMNEVKMTITYTRGGQGRSFITNKKGKIFSPFVDVGEYNIIVEKEGYYVSQFTVKIRTKGAEIEMDETRTLNPTDTIPPIRFQADRSLFFRFILSRQVVAPPEEEQFVEMTASKRVRNIVEEVKGLYQIGKYQDGLDVINTKMEKFTDEPALYYLKGLILFKMEQKPDALQALNRCLELDPAYPDAHYYLGELYRDMGDSKNALVHYQKELERTPNNEAILIKAGLLFKKEEQLDQAVSMFEAVITIDPKEPRAKLELAELYQATGRMDDAKRLLAELETTGVQDAKSYFNLAVGYWNDKDYNLALETFVKATIADPQFALAHKQVGFCYVKLNEPNEAIPHLKKYVELDPQAQDLNEIKDLIKKLEKAAK